MTTSTSISNTFSEMELEGMKNGAFPMDKDEGRKACEAYRAELKKQGFRTELKYFTCGVYIVKIIK